MLAVFSDDLANVLGTYGVILFYFAVWGLVFAGTGLLVGAFIPFITGDTLLFSAGLIAARSESINITLLTLGVGFAAFAGDQVGYHLGQIFGRGYLEKHSGPFTRKAIARSENFYRMYGWWAVVVARFIPWGRVFVPVIAGIGKMNRMKFLTSNFVGATLWGIGLTLTGYYAAAYPPVRSAAYVIAFIVIGLSVIAGIRAWRMEHGAQHE